MAELCCDFLECFATGFAFDFSNWKWWWMLVLTAFLLKDWPLARSHTCKPCVRQASQTGHSVHGIGVYRNDNRPVTSGVITDRGTDVFEMLFLFTVLIAELLSIPSPYCLKPPVGTSIYIFVHRILRCLIHALISAMLMTGVATAFPVISERA